MLQGNSEFVRDCLERAECPRAKAKSAASTELKMHFERMEHSWRSLARSERISRWLDTQQSRRTRIDVAMQIFREAAFDPSDVENMLAVFESVRRQLGLTNGDKIAAYVASGIVGQTQHGAKDQATPAKLTVAALELEKP
jgi:hypothetical protein